MNPQGSDVTSAAMPTTIVNVRVHQGREGLFYATSAELRGLLVAEKTEEALCNAIPEAIREMYEACGMDVIVTSAGGQQDDLHPWIAMPVSVARAALDAASRRTAGD